MIFSTNCLRKDSYGLTQIPIIGQIPAVVVRLAKLVRDFFLSIITWISSALKKMVFGRPVPQPTENAAARLAIPFAAPLAANPQCTALALAPRVYSTEEIAHIFGLLYFNYCLTTPPLHMPIPNAERIIFFPNPQEDTSRRGPTIEIIDEDDSPSRPVLLPRLPAPPSHAITTSPPNWTHIAEWLNSNPQLIRELRFTFPIAEPTHLDQALVTGALSLRTLKNLRQTTPIRALMSSLAGNVSYVASRSLLTGFGVASVAGGTAFAGGAASAAFAGSIAVGGAVVGGLAVLPIAGGLTLINALIASWRNRPQTS